jgi:hypothetical protein
MTTKNQKKQFARRFSSDDWQTLCGKIEFLDALEESLELAEIVAFRILNPDLCSPPPINPVP